MIFKTTGEPVKNVSRLKDAADITGCDVGNISKVLSGKMNQTKGYTFVKSDGTLSKLQAGAFIQDFFLMQNDNVNDYIRKKLNGDYA